MSGQLIKPDAFAREIAVARTVPELVDLARKADTLIDYMRKAGRYDLETVQEFRFLQGDIIRRGGALLEKMAPKKPGPAGDNETSFVIYFETIEKAKLHKRSAENWRAASKCSVKKYQAFKKKLLKKGEVLKLTDLYRLGRPQQARERIKIVAEATGTYPVLYADPPWEYEAPPMGDTNRSPKRHYPTMTLQDIKEVSVPNADDAVLFFCGRPHQCYAKV